MDGVLKFFDLDRYELDEFCTMPNHVHVLVRPKSGWTLERIVHSWESYSAKEINRFLGRTVMASRVFVVTSDGILCCGAAE
jgi:REP element-mobilizing transposase RayT